MKKAKSVALIGAGKLTDSPLSRFYWLSDRLGPVKSSSFRLASRIANQLRAGHPVKDFEEFHSSELILVCVPESDVAPSSGRAGGRTHRFQRQGRGTEQLLAGQQRVARAFRPRSRGLHPSVPFRASTISATWWRETGRPCCSSRRLVEHRDRRAVTIERSLKPFYLAALTWTGSVLFSVLLAADESLRIAGDDSGRLRQHSGETGGPDPPLIRKSRPHCVAGPLANCPSKLCALAATDPDLAQYMEQSARLAEKMVKTR